MNTRHCVVLNKFIGQDVVLQYHGHLQDFRRIQSPSEAILCVANANVNLTNLKLQEMKRGIINRFKAELLQVFGSRHIDSFSRNGIEVK